MLLSIDRRNLEVNSTINGTNVRAHAAIESSIRKRAIGTSKSNSDPRGRRETTAHPITVNGFLDVNETTSTTTEKPRRTFRPTKSSRPASFLTNPNIPLETTTPLQRREIRPIDKDATKDDEKSTAIDKSPMLKNASETLVVAPPVLLSTGSTLWNRNWSQFFQETFLFSSPGIGMLVGYIPLSFALHKFGSRLIIAAVLILSALFVLLQPTAIAHGQIYVCLLRLLHGLTCSPLFAFIGANTAQWATLKEQLSFLSISLSSILLGPTISWLLVIKLIDVNDSDHLQLFHYILAASTILLALLWVLFYKDDPEKHRWINGNELNQIVTGKAQNNRLVDQNVTSLLLKSVSTWSLAIITFAYFSAFAVFANFLPVYLVTVLRLERPCAKTILTFLTPVVLHVFCLFCQKMCRGLSTTSKVRIYNSIGFLLCGALFAAIAAMPPGDHFVQTNRVLLMLVLLPLGFSTLGFIYSAVVYGRYFTQYIICNMQGPFALSMTLVPFLVVFLTVDNLLRYWRLTFLIVAVLMFLSCLAFGVLIRGQPATWAENSWNPSSTYKMRDLQTITNDDECGLMELRKIEDESAHHQTEC
ncbi:hypothetical protein M3Y95_01099600 [Aphelenchoides besseyi]|nr:hypothetical protein M3Y95_01099600 [Aphelenchoides besseyi]